MEETKKLSSLSEIKNAISKKRNEFYSSPENKADNVKEAFSVTNRFIYGENGLKTIPCNYNVSRYALAEMVKEAAASGNTDWNAGLAGIECFAFLRTAISGIRKGENEYLNENNEYVLQAILGETKLKPEMIEYVILDGIQKCDTKESISKSALAGWLNKVTYLMKNKNIPERSRAAIALNARLIADYVKWRSDKESDIPSVADSLKILAKDSSTQRLRSPSFANQIQNNVKEPEKIHVNPGYDAAMKAGTLKRQPQHEADENSELPEDAADTAAEEETQKTGEEDSPVFEPENSMPSAESQPQEEPDYDDRPDFFRNRSTAFEINDTPEENRQALQDAEETEGENEVVDFFENEYLNYVSPARNDIGTILNTISNSASAIEHFDENNESCSDDEKQRIKINAQRSANKLWKSYSGDEKKRIVSINRKNAKNASSIIENYAYGEPGTTKNVSAGKLYEIVKEVQDNITSSFNVIQ